MTGSGMVTLVVVGAFVCWVALHTIEDALWRRDERRAGRFLAAQIPPPPPAEPVFTRSADRMPSIPIEDLSAFELAMEEWGADLMPTFSALHDLDLYWAEDWELA